MENFSVFLSMTDETLLKKYKTSFENICSRIGPLLDVRIDVVHWRKMSGGLANRAQDVIDRQSAAQQVYFGLMGTKFGAGTEHEYRKAVKSYIKAGSPAFVSFGFCQEKIDPYTLDLTSFAKLKKFRDEIGDRKRYGKANLYFTFTNVTEFEPAVERNLKSAIDLLKGGVAGGPRFKASGYKSKR